MITPSNQVSPVTGISSDAAELYLASTVLRRAQQDFDGAVARGYGRGIAREKLEAARERFDKACGIYEPKLVNPVIRADELRQNANDDLYDLN